MQTIPYGQTISYAEEARRAGHPTALRAIGNANHRNPIVVIVPCHRVVASHGKIGGYGGGLDRKRFLLNLECSDVFFPHTLNEQVFRGRKEDACQTRRARL